VAQFHQEREQIASDVTAPADNNDPRHLAQPALI
jgi:hypothetical protein